MNQIRESATVTLSSCRVHYRVSGTGPALVCLHPSSGVRITAATELLMRHFTVYLPACPGMDESPPPSGDVSVPHLADWIAEFIDTVIGTAVHLSGHSFGGWVAQWLAVRRPELVRTLVLQCPIGAAPLKTVPAGASAAALLARTYSHPERRRPEEKPEAVTAANRGMAAKYGNGIVIDAALLDRVTCLQAPVLILHGHDDGIVAPEGMRLLAETIPKARLVEVEDAAHAIEVDQPELYARLVTKFLLNQD